MTDVQTDALAAEFTSRLLAVDGVLRLFPRHPVARALRIVADAPSPLVDVDLTGGTVTVAARIGIARTTPAAAVIDGVVAALAGVSERPAPRLDLEIAYIE